MLGVVVLVVIFYFCVSMGCLDGGFFDEILFCFIGSMLVVGVVNIKKLKIVFDFDEFIKFEKVSEKVVVLFF